MIEIFTYESIKQVPQEWDSIVGDNIYMTTQFLSFMEDVDDCHQRYYALYKDGQLDTVFMTYERKHYNLGMFTKINLYQDMTFVYVPLSVTRPGIVYNQCLQQALDYIKKMKGPKILLNLEDMDLKGFAKGLTCPKCIFTNRFSSFEDYLGSLRSNYRRRYKQALKKSQDLTLTYLENNADFTEEMYNCYLQVYNKSRVKIEKLPISFFRGDIFKIFTLSKEDKVVGFCQLLENGSELIFEFVGVDYAYNAQYDVYHRILLEIVRYGIENGFKTIDFGQTADESKLKLGSEYTYLYAYLHHSNWVKNKINQLLGRFLSYKYLTTKFDVFKGENGNDESAAGST